VDTKKACRKQAFATRDDALAAMKQLVFDNHVRGRDARSAGLNVYPCDPCDGWHIGHSSLQTPTIYHYDVMSAFDAIEAAGALRPPKPTRIPTHKRRAYTGAQLARHLETEERAPMLWFSWNAAWTFLNVPHPGTFVGQAIAARMGEGLMRFAVPAWVAKLRWSDYLRRNDTPRWMRAIMADEGNAAEWLATDQPVPLDDVRSIEAWYRGRWINAAELPDDFDDWLTEQKGK
jgi:hypothetical protein